MHTEIWVSPLNAWNQHVGAYSVGGTRWCMLNWWECFSVSRVWYFSVETLVRIEAIKTDGECHNFNLDDIKKQPTNSVKIPTRFLLPFLRALFPTFFYVLYFLLC